MKKQLICIAILSAFALQACKKDKEPQPDNIPAYKQVNATLDFSNPVILDVDNDEESDFTFFAVSDDDEGGITYLSVYSEVSKGYKVIVRTEPVEEDWGFWAKAFDKGAEISATAPAEYKWNSNLTTAFLLISDNFNNQSDRYGPWLDKQNGYLGFQFKKGEKIHYGWVRLSHITGTDKIKVEDYAYNPVAGQAIKAGDK